MVVVLAGLRAVRARGFSRAGGWETSEEARWYGSIGGQHCGGREAEAEAEAEELTQTGGVSRACLR